MRPNAFRTADAFVWPQLYVARIRTQNPCLPLVAQAYISRISQSLSLGPGANTGVTTSIRFERLRNIQSADPMKYSP